MRTRQPSGLVAGWLVLAGGLTGCGLLKTTAEMPGRVATAALNPGGKPAPADPLLMQTRFMRFADLFATEVEQATLAFAERTGTPEGRIQALEWRIDYANAIWRLASGSRPYAALFDAIIVITFVRHVHEQHWSERWGEADRPMVEALTRLEESVWSLTAEGLPEPYLGQVRQIVADWMAGDPTSRISEVAKLPGFTELGGTSRANPGLVSELTSLVRLDTLSGLEPMVREVAQSRQLLERIFYYLQRQPELLSARVELLVLRASHSPEAQGTLASVERVSQAAASLAATAAALPASVAAEREAALAQLSAELTAQRAGLVADLETARAPLVEILTETQGTAEAGRAMADSLTGTLTALDAFVGRFDDGDEPPAAPEVAPEADQEVAPAPASKPFDVAEYGLAAERIGVAAHELEQTIATLERSLPEVQRVLDETTARAARAIDHAWKRALQLVGFALGGLVLALVIVRRVPRA